MTLCKFRLNSAFSLVRVSLGTYSIAFYYSTLITCDCQLLQITDVSSFLPVPHILPISAPPLFRSSTHSSLCPLTIWKGGGQWGSNRLIDCCFTGHGSRLVSQIHLLLGGFWNPTTIGLIGTCPSVCQVISSDVVCRCPWPSWNLQTRRPSNERTKGIGVKQQVCLWFRAALLSNSAIYSHDLASRVFVRKLQLRTGVFFKANAPSTV